MGLPSSFYDAFVSTRRARMYIAPLPDEAGEDGRFVLTIEDDGPGIPEEKAREALRRGGRLDETKPGTGLGLAIVSELVKEYGGDLSLGKSPLGGLCVRVVLKSAS